MAPGAVIGRAPRRGRQRRRSGSRTRRRRAGHRCDLRDAGPVRGSCVLRRLRVGEEARGAALIGRRQGLAGHPLNAGTQRRRGRLSSACHAGSSDGARRASPASCKGQDRRHQPELAHPLHSPLRVHAPVPIWRRSRHRSCRRPCLAATTDPLNDSCAGCRQPPTNPAAVVQPLPHCHGCFAEWRHRRGVPRPCRASLPPGQPR